MAQVRWSKEDLEAYRRRNAGSLVARTGADEAQVGAVKEKRGSAKQTGELVLELPVPPSTNMAYQNAKGGRTMSKRGKEYKRLVREIAFIQSLAQRWSYSDGTRLSLTLRLYFPTHRRRDISNAIKLAEDSIAEALGFDDLVVDVLHVERKENGSSNPRCEARLKIVEVK